MAIVSLIALLAALVLAALISLRPWGDDSVAPGLSLAPDLGVAVEDAVALPSSRGPAVAVARPADAGERVFAAQEAPLAKNDASRPHLAVAPARPVAAPANDGPQGGSPNAPASEPPPPPAPPPPAAIPVAAPAPSPSPAAPAPTPAKVPIDPGAPGGPTDAGGGVVDGGPGEAVEVHTGDEYAFSFSFYLEPTAYRAPDTENLIMRFKGATAELPTFGLQLWDDGAGGRGLWASGEAMGGERFLAPLAEREWHEAIVCFRAASEGDGFYLLLLDGEPIDTRAWVSLIDSGSSSTLIEAGLFRDGVRVEDATEIFFGPAGLSETLEPVIP